MRVEIGGRGHAFDSLELYEIVAQSYNEGFEGKQCVFKDIRRGGLHFP